MEPTVPTIVSEPTPTLAQKPKVDIVKILLAIIISAVISGGFVWYFMDQKSNSSIAKLNAQITSQEKSIAKLTATVTGLASTSSGSTTTTPTTSATTDNDLIALRAFCTAETTLTLSEVILEINSDGTFGSCGLSDSQSGVVKLAAKVDGIWTKVFTGNGDVPSATIAQYKLPLSISRAYIAR